MLEVKVENCAGIDVGKKFLAVPGNVLSDVFGSSGRVMLEALLENKHSTAEMVSQIENLHFRQNYPVNRRLLFGF